MKLKVKTDKLKEMVARVVKGAGNNKLIPLTQMIGLRMKKGVLTLTTTDGTNYLYIIQDKLEGEDFETVVPVELFSKLISKLTCESVTLEEKGTVIEITGNGKYSVPIQYDENGDVVNYPDPLSETKFKAKASSHVEGTTISFVLNSVKPALATTLEVPCYTGYYVGERVVATDSCLINSLDVALFKEPKLVSSEMMDLLSVMDSEKINVDFKDSVICFRTPDCVLYGRELPGIEDYPIEAITPYITEMEFPSSCEVPKTTLLQLLDRLSLFVGTYDKNSIKLVFTKEGIQFSSVNSSGTELVPYVDSKDFKNEFICSIDVVQFTKQVRAQTGETVKIYYGIDNAIKLVQDKLTQIIALLEEDEEE